MRLTKLKIPRWVFITVFDIATEVVVIILPTFPLRGIQMEPYGKFKVMLSFSCRIIPIAFSALCIWSISRAVLNPTGATNGSAGPLTGPTTAVIIPSMFQQFELMLSMSIAAILPCFRLLFQVCEDVGNTPTQRGDQDMQDSKPPQVASERRNGSRSGKVSFNSGRDIAGTYWAGSTTEAERISLHAPQRPRLSSSSLLGSDHSSKKADSVG